MKDQRVLVIKNAVGLAMEAGAEKVFLFLNTARDCAWFLRKGLVSDGSSIVVVVPSSVEIDWAEFGAPGVGLIRCWSGNQSRFSRVKYAFLHGVLQGLIDTKSRIVCVLGPWGRSHLDTITIHDLALSWSEEFPFDPRSLIKNKSLTVVLAVIDVALDIGALGREGEAVGTTFVIGDSEKVMSLSHQAVFNPFKGYPEEERMITSSEVVESVKELAQLDGAFVISDSGVVEAAGRHLDARSHSSGSLKGLGSRHRAAAGITKTTGAVAVVVSESTGRVTVFEKGRVVSTLEPVIGRRLV